MQSSLFNGIASDPYNKLLKTLSDFPNLDTLVLDIGHNTIKDHKKANESRTSSLFYHFSCLILSALLRTCYRRTLAPSEHRRIKSLCIRNTPDLFNLDHFTPMHVEQAIIGMSHIESLTLDIRVGDILEGLTNIFDVPQYIWTGTWGSIVRSTDKIKSLSLQAMNHGVGKDRNGITIFEHIFSYPGHPERSIKQFNFMTSLTLERMDCRKEALSLFLKKHRTTLETIVLNDILMTGKDDEEDTQVKFSDPWSRIFNAFKEQEPADKVVRVNLMDLSWFSAQGDFQSAK